ncbi:hypothetical protein QBC46DRAFT_315584 [Diplogelasinospora grovesii]|uniref:FAD-binding FR-type domain-containing protein n=1 Tax=Diplogelasinospora grovesii TaxID=303347 RepID=A0AAN6N899_9PEZI|nr:hypothetical protein QBC46DRAFT_315584 [Diplogelasinospora grovesii]
MLLESDLSDNVDQTLLEWRYGKPLNERSFVPFTIVSKEVVSPTAFIMTIQPKFLSSSFSSSSSSSSSSSCSSSGSLPGFLRESHSHGSVLQKAWDHGLWSVEIKQPQLQVAREYTPLPPLPHTDLPRQSGGGTEVGSVEEDIKDGRMRFLIRRMDGGEVSTYLSTLQPGDTVELRGPHLGFDVRKRLGSEERLVVLAGGTGIAPALQAVHALFNTEGQTGGIIERGVKEKKRVDIIWANRHRADCIGCPPNRDNNVGPIVGWLEMMRNKYGERLRYKCTVDEEGEFITREKIREVTDSTPTVTAQPTSSVVSGAGCPYHDAAKLITSTAKDPVSNTKDEQKCQCVAGKRGKNLLMISGPDGFIEVLAGKKIWANGQELQGPVGGVFGDLTKKNPGFWRDWLVLKL